MIWSPRRGFCFIHISKTGGTAVEEAYQPHIRFGDILLGARRLGLEHFYKMHLNAGKHSPAKQAARLIGPVRFRAAFSFAVVRDPLDRMLSYYRWIHGNNHTGNEKRLKEFIDFETFIHNARKALPRQVLMVTDPDTGEILVSKLIHYSRLAEGWEEVCRRIGIEAALPHANVSKPQAVDVTDSARNLIRELYAPDYELIERAERQTDNAKAAASAAA